MLSVSEEQVEITLVKGRDRGGGVMKKTKAYRSEAAFAIHETATSLFEAGIIDKQTMREFDESCLLFIHELAPRKIRAQREGEQAS
jgi:putative transcriptional regulator